MAKRITCTNEKGASVYFDYNFTPFFLVSCDGLYKVSNNINRTDNANTDGSTSQGSNTKERNIVITAQMDSNYQQNRDILYRCFRPKTKGILVHEENGVQRQIEYLTEDIDIGETGVVRDIVISLIAGDPFFTDVNYTEQLMASWESGFEFEHEFLEEGKEIGFRTMELIKDMDNHSTTDKTGVIIRMEALSAVKNPTVRNITTGEYIKVNITMKYGDVLEIVTETNKKNVYLTRDEEKTSINGYIEEESEYIQLEAGLNTIQYEAEEGTESLNVTVAYKQRYLGV